MHGMNYLMICVCRFLHVRNIEKNQKHEIFFQSETQNTKQRIKKQKNKK